MTDVAIIRTSSFEKLLSQISTKFNQVEAAEVVRLLKRQYPTKKDSFDQNDLCGALKQLYILGAIDDDGDQKLLEILAGKNIEVLKMLSGYKEASSSRKDDFVGRDVDVSNILKRLKNHRVPGVNLFGDSGVGKTTLAKEVSKRLESFDTVFVDLRNIKCLKTVYFHILQALQLPSWDENKRERIYKHLEILKKETVLILDNIEQFFSKESEVEQETRADFLEFLKVIISSEASKRGHLKVILTSTTELNKSELKGKLFTEYKVQPFSKNISRYFISKRVRGDVSDDQQGKTMFEIAVLCCNNPYLLHGAEQLMRESFATPADVLRKITAQIGKGVPEHFACINALFESLPNDHLKQVAVKISLLRRPFTVSTASKITEASSGYDTEFDLEMLAVHKIITAENVEEKRHNETKKKRKYDLHALFRDFVTSHLCKKDPVYKEQLKKGENQFFKHFAGKITKLANNLEREFVKTYVNLEINRANFELVIDLSEDHKETFDLLLHTDDHNQLALMGILFEVLKDEKERKELFGKWAEAAEKQEQWLTSSLMRCWQSIQGSDLEGTVNEEILEKAKTSIEKVHSTSPDEKLSKKLNEVNSLFLHCQGKIKWMKAKKLTPEQKTRKHVKKLLEEGIEHFKQSIEMRKQLNGDSTLTARALNLIGNCYMELEDPLTAMTHYKQAMDMKVRLVGSENHWEIPTYYNQMAQVHDGLARKEDEKWYKRLFGFKAKAREEYGKAKKWMEKALALQEELGVSDTNHTALFQRNLANILIGLGKYDQALEHAQKSFEITNEILGKHPDTVRILYLIGIIHEWKNDLEGALASYEEAFVMEESLPEDNHSIVRKLLCDRLEAMCKKLKKKDKKEKLKERITKMRKIESSTPVRKDNTPATLTEPGIADTEHPVQEDLSDVQLPPDDTPVAPTEQGIADTEHPVQEDLPDVQLPPDDTPVTPTEQGIADTEHPVQEYLPGVPLPPDDTPVTPTEPEIDDIEHPPDVPLPPDDTFVVSSEPGLEDAEHSVQEDLGIPVVTGIIDKIPSQCNTIIPEGGSVDIPMIGIRLDIPPNTVTQATTVICKKYTAESLPVTFPAGKDETVVSYIVGLEPSTIQLNKPISVSLMHSGPRTGYGYETVVKAFNQDNETWQEPIVLDRRQENVSAHCRNDYVKVEISTPTILAVVTRLITDRFQITPKGCVVRSSVCDDVTIEFPQGAVDKTVEGTMKLLPMPKNIYKVFDVYASQMILIKGFENVELLKSVTIQMPHPCSTRYTTGQAKLLRLKNNEWEEVGDPKIEIKDAYIKFQVQHFCWLWLMIGSTVAVASACKIHEYLSTKPAQAAFIAASRDQKLLARRIKLHCLANHRQGEIWDYGNVLEASTVEEMRPGETVYTKIEGSFETSGEISLKFLQNEEFSRLIVLQRKRQNTETGKQKVQLLFYKKENEEMPLCEFNIEENMIDPECHALSDSLSQDGTGTSAASINYTVNVSGSAVAAIGPNSSVNSSQQHNLRQYASLASIDPAQQSLPPAPSPSTAGSPTASSPAAVAEQTLHPASAPSTAGSPTASSPAAVAEQTLHPASAPSTAGSPTASSPAAVAEQTLHPSSAPSTAGSPTASSPAAVAEQTLHPASAPSTAGSPTASSPAADVTVSKISEV